MYLRIEYDIYTSEKSLTIEINMKDWDNETQTIRNKELDTYRLNQKLAEYKTKLQGAYFMLTKFEGVFTLKEIIATAFGTEKRPAYSLFNVFEEEINQRQKALKPGQTDAYGRKHVVCMNHLKEFVQKQYKIKDLAFSRINPDFIKKFMVYMKTEGGNGHNSTMKLLQIFKKVYQVAVNNRWVAYNAFAGMRFSYHDTDPVSLTTEELNIVAEKPVPIERLERVRNIFLFGCYTGLAYTDLMHLQRRHIDYNPLSHIYYIKKKREKTGVLSLIPLFKPTRDILAKWFDVWEELEAETLLVPHISNQKYNAYLKEVGEYFGITKVLVSHSARHSFASTVSLENGVSMETTSKMMGHTKISQTQKYAKVTEMKVALDTNKLFQSLEHTGT